MNDQSNICPYCGSARRFPPKAAPDFLRKAARPLASHLALVHNIPADRSLVCLLGDGSETDNHEALRSWVIVQIGELERWPLPSDEVAALLDELERNLGRLLAGIQTRIG